jgi:hypothetical protein
MVTYEPTSKDHIELLERIDAGDFHTVPGGLKHGEESARLGQTLLMDYTSTDTIEDAMHVALGRPRKTASSTIVMKATMPSTLVDRLRTFAASHHVSISHVIRHATYDYLNEKAS